MMKYVVLSVALFAAAACAESLDDLSDFQGEGRILNSIFNTSSLGLTLPDWRAVVALLAIGLVVLGYALKAAPAPAAYDKNYYEQGYDYYSQDAYNGQETFNSRYGITSNLSTKMSQLEQAIKKYGNDTEECQKYIACVEAATADCAVQQNECISSVNSRQ